MDNVHAVEFVRSGRGKARCPANPMYPNGIELDVSRGVMVSCTVPIPYPSPECGIVRVECRLCHIVVAATVAGRADDPVSIKLPCKLRNKPAEA